jgi:hypothetical protein
LAALALRLAAGAGSAVFMAVVWTTVAASPGAAELDTHWLASTLVHQHPPLFRALPLPLALLLLGGCTWNALRRLSPHTALTAVALFFTAFPALHLSLVVRPWLERWEAAAWTGSCGFSALPTRLLLDHMHIALVFVPGALLLVAGAVLSLRQSRRAARAARILAILVGAVGWAAFLLATRASLFVIGGCID